MVSGGASQALAAKALGVDENTVRRWVKAWRAAGAAALQAKRRGRRPGEQKCLSASQERAIQQRIGDRCPDPPKLPFARWSREAVRGLIEARRGVVLALTTVGDSLRRWGFTPQRPVERAIERQDAEIRAWLAVDHPVIAARAKIEGAEIHLGDETGISHQASHGRSFAPRGRTPIVARTAKRQTTRMISTVTNRGTTRFMIDEGALNVALFLRFLERSTGGSRRRIFLIVDDPKVHHATAVEAWVAANPGKIRLFFLPASAPEHDPDELLDSDAKRRLAKRPAPRHRAAPKAHLRADMRRLQRMPDRIRTVFRAPTTA